MTDRSLDDATSRVRTSAPPALLDGLSGDVRARLLAGASTWTAPAGTPIFPPAAAWTRAAVLVDGVARALLAAGDGRQLTVRYVRPGEMIGNVFAVHGTRAPLAVSAVTDCTVHELDTDALSDVIRTNAEVAHVVLEILSRRLEDLYATLAANTFGSMRERVAGHLLDLALPDPGSGVLIAPVTQQQLADSVGSVREVIARVLKDFREEGLIATSPRAIELRDPSTLASLVGRWRPAHPD